MNLLKCISRAIINFFAYLILSLVAIYCLIFIANFLTGQTLNLTHGEYFLVWIVMAVFIRQVSGDISVLFFKKSERE
jgi:TctA family transporter